MEARRFMQIGRSLYLLVAGTKFEKIIHDAMVILDSVHDGFDMGKQIQQSINDMRKEENPSVN